MRFVAVCIHLAAVDGHVAIAAGTCSTAAAADGRAGRTVDSGDATAIDGYAPVSVAAAADGRAEVQSGAASVDGDVVERHFEGVVLAVRAADQSRRMGPVAVLLQIRRRQSCGRVTAKVNDVRMVRVAVVTPVLAVMSCAVYPAEAIVALNGQVHGNVRRAVVKCLVFIIGVRIISADRLYAQALVVAFRTAGLVGRPDVVDGHVEGTSRSRRAGRYNGDPVARCFSGSLIGVLPSSDHLVDAVVLCAALAGVVGNVVAPVHAVVGYVAVRR